VRKDEREGKLVCPAVSVARGFWKGYVLGDAVGFPLLEVSMLASRVIVTVFFSGLEAEGVSSSSLLGVGGEESPSSVFSSVEFWFSFVVFSLVAGGGSTCTSKFTLQIPFSISILYSVILIKGGNIEISFWSLLDSLSPSPVGV